MRRCRIIRDRWNRAGMTTCVRDVNVRSTAPMRRPKNSKELCFSAGVNGKQVAEVNRDGQLVKLEALRQPGGDTA